MRVGIYQSEVQTYSVTWMQAEEFPEKDALRALARLLGHPDGNPFRELVRPGDHVVIKPNWVMDKHPLHLDIFSIVTHPALLRAVTDLVFEAVKGDVAITIADAPQSDCNFENLMNVTQSLVLQEYYWKKYQYKLVLRDLRQLGVVVEDGYVRAEQRIHLPGDPEGYAVISLGNLSAFTGMPGVERLYGADYDRSETIQHHNSHRHEYLVSKTVLGADLLISVPKLKTHKKVGVTLNAKAMVGINGNKNWLAHFRVGSPTQGGDQYPDTEAVSAQTIAGITRFLVDKLLASESRIGERLFGAIRTLYRHLKPTLGLQKKGRLSYDAGNWYGNDTAWRMTADLAQIVLFADLVGQIHEQPQRRFFSVIDGIVAGEGEGPLSPTPKPVGVLLGGSNLLAVDLVGARLMGYDWRKIKSLAWLSQRGFQAMRINNPAMEIEVCSNCIAWESLLCNEELLGLNFEPHPGWKGHIEIKL